MSAYYVSYAVLWVLFLVLAVMVLLLYRHFGVIAIDSADGHARDGIAVGSRAPSSTLSDYGTSRLDLADVSKKSASILLFASASCGPCQGILPYFDRLAQAYRDSFHVAAITPSGDQAELRALAPTLDVVVDTDSEISAAFGVKVSPFAFVIDSRGVVQSKGLVSEVGHVRRLLRQGGYSRVAEDAFPEQPVPNMKGERLELL
jgi:thiol-disulfide isomerase/thioredoxin